MNVLLVTGRLESPLVEGTQKSVLNLANELIRRDHNITWLARKNAETPKQLSNEVEVVRKDFKFSNIPYFRNLAKEKDIVNVHTSSVKMSFFWKLIARKIIVTWPARRSRTKLDKTLQKLTLNTAVTPTVQKWLPDNPKLTPYSVNLDIYDYQSSQQGGQLEICYIGKPSSRRGFDHLCSAMSQLEIDFKFKYALAELRGDIEEAKSKIEKYGLEENTEMHYGYVEDLPEFLGSADIFANLVENTRGITSPPILTLEAMACRTATISSNVSDFSDIIEDDKSGYLVDYNDYDKIADIITYLDKNRDELERIGENGREVVKTHHSIERSADKFIEAYKSLI